MKKRLITALFACLCITVAQAQHAGRFLDLQLGGGLHSLQYHNLNGQNHFGAGGQFNVAYRYMFHPNWGFSAGFELNYSHAQLQLDGTHTYYDAEKGQDYAYTFENFVEHNNFLDFNVPVEMVFQTAINEQWSFLCGLGVKLAFYEYNNFAAKGILDDGTNRDEQFTASAQFGSELPTIGCDALIDLGFHYAFNERIAIYTGLYASYGLTNHLLEHDRPIIGGDYPYGGVTGSNACPYANSVTAGIKIGFTYSFPNRDSLEEEPGEAELADPHTVAY
ncbi:MAG: hypothetical protein J6Y77_02355 [Paludibacteraceae bacterium]|nr:hypothetical protein [Paludibacteraceae bacterium]